MTGEKRNLESYPARGDYLGNRFLGRQAIYDQDLKVYGHELLFRSGEGNAFQGDGEEATRQMIDNCLQFLPEKGHGISFINCTRKSLITGMVTLLPAENSVLEILEDVLPDAELMECCRELKLLGYRFALDDFTPDEENQAFLEIADFIKIDFRCTDLSGRHAIYQVADCKRHTLIAEKVETQEEIELARAEGCHLFQGYFLSKPCVTSIKTVHGSPAVSLQLLALLSKASVDFAAFVKLVEADASICYRVLRTVNSARYGTIHGIQSVQMALIMIGTDELRKLILVSILASHDSSCPSTLVIALERARFCEQLAPILRCDASSMYLLGMMSVMDTILNVSMGRILEYVPLDNEIADALMGRPNTMRTALDLLIYREGREWEKSAAKADALGISQLFASDLYLRSVLWADDRAWMLIPAHTDAAPSLSNKLPWAVSR